MKSKKILAAKILKTSPKKIKFVGDAMEDIKKAITRSDIRGLIFVKKIIKSTQNEHSRAGARKVATQKRKGRQKGRGSKKGKKHSIVSRKTKWMVKVRTQRKLLKELRDKGVLSRKNFSNLYAKTNGGYFRSKRHIKLYLTEHKLIENSTKNDK
jgi:large subunit ribosomal protein L19e